MVSDASKGVWHINQESKKYSSNVEVLLNSEQNDEGCDATKADSSNVAGYQKIETIISQHNLKNR
jgi:hypothetical protein